MSLREWWAGGRREAVTLQGVERAVFVRRMGNGPSMTLLHGFPSSSHDWAKVADALAEGYSLTMPDLLGFGASDKPKDHDYSFTEQADLVEAVWERYGIASTIIVAHDYSVTVTQELLARRADGALAVDLASVYLLNGGLYPDLHRPQPIQHALLDPEQGPTISAAMTEELLTAALVPTFGEGFDARADAANIWAALSRDDGQANAHLLIRYIDDRFRNAERWVGALEATDVPLAFIWGMLDPISGAHIAERIRERFPAAPFTALEDVAHWPPLEAPERVVAALLDGRRLGSVGAHA